MRLVYLTSYSVQGIKSLDQLITLSFYKKTITKNMNTQDYNVKGIYGMNGSGKTGIVASIDILRNLLTNQDYLNNPIAQKNLDAIINKKTNELYISAEYVMDTKELPLYKYEVKLSKDNTGKYVISYEKLTSKKATSKSYKMKTIFEVSNGKISTIATLVDEDASDIINKTVNLLSTNPLALLYINKVMPEIKCITDAELSGAIMFLVIFALQIHVYLEQSDDHRTFIINSQIEYVEKFISNTNLLQDYFSGMNGDCLDIIKETGNIVSKEKYEYFKECIGKLYEFIHIFKPSLKGIEIDKKDDKDTYVCDLLMKYDDYKINAEFESTGIKKLINLYAYIREMAHGGIVFIDELDSNLHDVYLCALLEYLMGNGKGQLCFTTHNVGPMDILKRNKKSIDFLSSDRKIYPWVTNGNYSPSKLYKNGMIEGSPFNIDSIDFIGVF